LTSKSNLLFPNKFFRCIKSYVCKNVIENIILHKVERLKNKTTIKNLS
jgi:hypothetical protein